MTCSSHSGTALYEIYIAGWRNLDVLVRVIKQKTVAISYLRDPFPITAAILHMDFPHKLGNTNNLKTCLLKLNLCSNANHFSSLCCMHIPVFEVMSVYPIDQYQNTTPRVMPLHELKKAQLPERSKLKSWHMILLVIWKCSAWAFIVKQSPLSLNGNATAHLTALKKC